jgi:hypothetical protein
MSIATLKRKTQAKYNNSSVGQTQFSLNGTHRSQGYVGQTMLSRSLPRTLMKGNVIRGHGGCCGQYPIKTIVQSSVNYQEDSQIVKPSVINTAGMIENKYQCIGYCSSGTDVCDGSMKRVNHVLKTVDSYNYTQEAYIKRMAKDAVRDTNACNLIHKDDPIIEVYCDKTLKLKKSTTCTITKSDQECKIPISSGEHTIYLNNGCVANDVYEKLPGASNSRIGIPFAC